MTDKQQRKADSLWHLTIPFCHKTGPSIDDLHITLDFWVNGDGSMETDSTDPKATERNIRKAIKEFAEYWG